MEEVVKNKVLWIHNFKNEPAAGGGWMFNQYKTMSEGVDLYYLSNLRNPFFVVFHLFKLFSLSKKYGVIHAQYGSAVGFLTAFLPGKKVLTLRGSDWYSPPPRNFYDSIRIKLGTFLTQKSIRRFDIVIAVSHKMMESIKEKFPEIKLEVIVGQIDLDYFQENGSTRQKGSKVLFAAYDLLSPTKRLSLAKAAIAHVKEEIPECELVLLTGKPHKDVKVAMLNTDLILLTSSHEGWPNVIIEMLALNRPFVSTNVSDLQQVADRTNSCFVCEDDPRSLADGVIKSLLRPKESLRPLIKEFDSSNYVKKLKAVYTSLHK